MQEFAITTKIGGRTEALKCSFDIAQSQKFSFNLLYLLVFCKCFPSTKIEFTGFSDLKTLNQGTYLKQSCDTISAQFGVGICPENSVNKALPS